MITRYAAVPADEPSAPPPPPLRRSRRRNVGRWGLAVVILTECARSTHGASAEALWHRRENFKDYYHRKFHGASSVGGGPFGAGGGGYGGGKPGTSSSALVDALVGSGMDSCDFASSSSSSPPSRPIRAQTDKRVGHYVPRFSRLSRRLPARPTDCCVECRGCMSRTSLDEHGCRGGGDPLSVPRGGHVHHHARVAEDVVAGGAAAAAAAAASVAAATPYGIPLNVWKIIFQAMLTTINVVCWLVPLRSKTISENKLGLSLANAFSGGVFLSLAFGHLIPECVHGFHGTDVNEALPYMIVLGGYLLIFFVEKVAFDAHEIMHEMESGGGGGHSHGGHSHGGHSHGPPQSDAKENGSGPAPARQDSPPPAFAGRSAVILLGALAVHSVLEMTALGLADSFGDSALLSLSIALHQPAESIALLVAFLKSGMPKDQIVKFLSIFSCMGPVGVAIGMAVNSFASPVVDATMLAVVAGTFVYVGATEVIPEEWEESEHKWKKFVALVSGIVTIFAITQYTMTLEEGF